MENEAFVNTQELDISIPEEFAEAILTQGLTLAEIKGIELADLEGLYAEAREKLVSGNLEGALDDLVLLVSHNPWDWRFSYAFGVALQQAGAYQEAAQHLARSLLLDATNAGCAFKIAQCLEAQGDRHHAAEALRVCVELSWGDPKWEAVRAVAQRSLVEIERK